MTGKEVSVGINTCLCSRQISHSIPHSIPLSIPLYPTRLVSNHVLSQKKEDFSEIKKSYKSQESVHLSSPCTLTFRESVIKWVANPVFQADSLIQKWTFWIFLAKKSIFDLDRGVSIVETCFPLIRSQWGLCHAVSW